MTALGLAVSAPEQLQPQGQLIDIDATGEAYVVDSPDAAAPVVICVGGWGEAKEQHLSLVAPALRAGLSIALLDVPRPGNPRKMGHDRMAVAAYIGRLIDLLEERQADSLGPVVVFGVGAGIDFAQQIARLDYRVSLVLSDVEPFVWSTRTALSRAFLAPASGIDAGVAATANRESREIAGKTRHVEAEAAFKWVATHLR